MLILAEKISLSHYQVVAGNQKYFVPIANFNELQFMYSGADTDGFKDALAKAADFVLMGKNVVKKACSAESLILHYIGASDKIDRQENSQNRAMQDDGEFANDWVEHSGNSVPVIDYHNQEINWRYRNGTHASRPSNLRSVSVNDWRPVSVLSDWRGWIHAEELNEDYHIIAYQIKDV